MKNRPLLSVCLMVLCIIASMVVWGRERFIKELRPSPIERYAAEGDNITICGKIYRQEQKENCRMIYLKENSIYSNSKKFQESKIIIYTNSSQKLHIGNQLKVCGKVSFYEEARNPGNFDQKFYYQKQGIHGKVRSDDIQITDYKRNKLKDRLEKFRMNWQKMLQREMGERDGSALAAILLGEKKRYGSGNERIISGKRDWTYPGDFRTSSIVCGTWSIPDSKENDRFIQGRWNHGRDSVVSVCDDDRNDRVGDPGVGDVRISDRCGYYR